MELLLKTHMKKLTSSSVIKRASSTYVILCDVVNSYWADEASNGAYAIGHPHENTGVSRRYIQVVHVEAYKHTRKY